MHEKFSLLIILFIVFNISGCQSAKTIPVNSAKNAIQVAASQCARDYVDVVLKNGIRVVRFRIDEVTDDFIAGWAYYQQSRDNYQKVYFKDMKSISLIENKSPVKCLL
jgi:hypothetical protein